VEEVEEDSPANGEDDDPEEKEAKTEYDLELERMKRKMWHTALFVNRPCTVIGIYAIIFVIFLGITGAGKLYEMDDQSDREFMVWDDIRTLRIDSKLEAQKEIQRAEEGMKSVRSQEMDEWNMNVIYECDGCDNMFTREKLLEIK